MLFRSQDVGIKENIVVQIRGSPPLLDLVIVDMSEDPIAHIILGTPFLRTIKDLINLHEGNVRLNYLLEILLLFIDTSILHNYFIC